jgi:glutamate carboxypeptidase
MPFPPKSEPKHLLSAAKEHYPAMLEQLETLVSIETPSQDKAAVNQAAHLLTEWLQPIGGKARWHRQKKFGDILEVRFPAAHSRTAKKNPAKPIMLLGHLDTVWPTGTLATMPFRIKNGRAYGPGIFDMKACVIMAVHALAILLDTEAPHPPVIVLLNSEEEVGSPDSRVVTKKLGQECSAVFVPSPQKAQKTPTSPRAKASVNIRFMSRA